MVGDGEDDRLVAGARLALLLDGLQLVVLGLGGNARIGAEVDRQPREGDCLALLHVVLADGDDHGLLVEPDAVCDAGLGLEEGALEGDGLVPLAGALRGDLARCLALVFLLRAALPGDVHERVVA